jgi:hypothetical protein
MLQKGNSSMDIATSLLGDSQVFVVASPASLRRLPPHVPLFFLE